MSAVLAPSAAVRPPRTAGARRALLALVFLGGFLALTVAFGGSAHAETRSAHAETKPAAGSASGSLLSHLTKHRSSEHSASKHNAGHGHSGSASRLLDDVKGSQASQHSGDSGSSSTSTHRNRDSVAGLTEERSVARVAHSGGVTHIAERTTRRAAKVVTPVTRKAVHTGQVIRPVDNAVHKVTGIVHLRGLTGRLGLTKGTGGHTGGAAAGGGTHAGEHPHTSPRHCAEGAKNRYAHGTSRLGRHAGGYSAHAGQAVADRGDGQGGGAPAPGSPLDHTPAAPVSSTVSQSMGNAHGPRGGGPYHTAGFLTGMERFGHLQPGATHAADGAPTRERSRDVLEFPG